MKIKRKKIIAVALVTVILSGNVMNICPLKVKAAEAAAIPFTFTAEMGAELMLYMYSVLESGMLAGRALETPTETEDFESMMAVADAYIDYSVYYSGISGIGQVCDLYLSDGTVVNVSYDEVVFNCTDGSSISITYDEYVNLFRYGTTTLDDDETDTDVPVLDSGMTLDDYIAARQAHLEELFEVYYEQYSNGDGDGDDDDPDDSTGEESGDSSGDSSESNPVPFSVISAVSVGTGMLALVGSFISALWNDEIEGLDKEDYFYSVVDDLQERYWDGTYDVTSTGEYIIKGNGCYYDSSQSTTFLSSYDTTSSSPLAIYLCDGTSYFYGYSSSSDSLVNGTVSYTLSKTKNGSTTTKEYKNYFYVGTTYGVNHMNIPIFTDKDALMNFLKTGDTSGIINAAPYDYAALADSVSTTLAPLAGVKHSSNLMPGINSALSTAAASVEPDTEADVATNTQTYAQTITETMAEVAPETETSTGGGTTSDTTTGTDTTDPDDDSEGDEERSSDILDFLNGLLILIYILFALLEIFLHCLEFIMNIFKIQPTTGFLPDDMVLGLDYLKSLEIVGIGMSVYDFMIGLVYIIILFYFIKVLRRNIDFIHIPKQSNGG